MIRLEFAACYLIILSLVVGCSQNISDQQVYQPETSQDSTVELPADEKVFTTRNSDVRLALPKDEDTFHFVLYGDRTGGVPAGLEVLKQAVKDTNLMDPDFVLTVGDLIQGYNRPEEWMFQMRRYKGIMEQLNMPWFPVAGNHDIYWASRDPERPKIHHEENYELHFGPLWYAFEHKHSGFIILFSDEGNPTTGEKSFRNPELQMVSDEQLDFLKQSLERFKDKKHVFLSLHHPRWIGGYYEGSNWPAVHKMLVEAGNVTAVFGGHIHRMRFDPKDGIDYFALATTGGSLSAEMPEVGLLHHYNVVSVRPDGYSVATVPVGTIIDPKKFTQDYLGDVEIVRSMRPSSAGDQLGVKTDGSANQMFKLAIPNPGSKPIEIELTPKIGADWQIVPDHQHLVVEPGQKSDVEFYFYREAKENGWGSFSVPSIEMAVDYLHDSARIELPTVEIPIDMGLMKSTDINTDTDLQNCLVLNGNQGRASGNRRNRIAGCARIESSQVNLGQGPFTLEAWVNPVSIENSQAVVAKTQSSEFALFLHNGVPQFDVHLNGKYVSPKGSGAVELNTWTHLAGVYDGEKVHLFVNGKLVQSLAGSGERTVNDLPLYIGADPNNRGNPTRPIVGKIDEVRLSNSVRYNENFDPASRLVPDESTRFLLHLDQSFGPFLLDASENDLHFQKLGPARISSK